MIDNTIQLKMEETNEVYNREREREIEQSEDEEIVQDLVQQPEAEGEICLLCRTPHSVHNCTNGLIREFEVLCVSTFQNSVSFDEFHSKMYLLIGSMLCIRAFMAFAIRDCGCSRMSTIERCMDAITNYLDTNYTLGESIDRETSISRLLSSISVASEGSLLHRPGSLLQRFVNLRLRRDAVEHHIVEFGFGLPIHNIQEPVPLHMEIEVITSLEEGDKQCSVCWETTTVNQFVGYCCGHEFCKDCVLNTIDKRIQGHGIMCALCRSPVNKIVCKSQEISSEFEEYLHK